MKPPQAKAIAGVVAVVASIVIFFAGMVVAQLLTGPIQTQEGNLRNVAVLAFAAIGGVAIYRWLNKRLSSN